jgi:methylated-DNA-[protein]-cysteine S-methyltransferase
MLAPVRNPVSRSYFRATVESPVGTLRLFGGDSGLAALLWRDDSGRHLGAASVIVKGSHPVLMETQRQLREYFAGARREFELPLDFVGTEFQKSVWSALLTIPYGETRTYAQIAVQVGKPAAVRAVGAANGRNPISIVTPCHRVIGTNGDLTGFGGGMENKAILLALESPQQDLLASGANHARRSASR